MPRGAKSRMRRTETLKPIWIKFWMVVDIPDVVSPSVPCSFEVVLFLCPTNECVSYVLSSDQLNKLFSSLCLQNSVSVGYDLNTQARGRIIDVSKTLCDFGHEIILKKSTLVNYRHIPTLCNLLRVPRCRQN